MALQLSNPDCVHLWRMPLDSMDFPIAPIAEILSTEELVRAARFRFAADRHTFMAAHALLRRILAKYLGCSAAEIAFRRGSHGKPILADASNLHFNLSYADNVALLGVASREIGIDVERIRPDFAWRPIVHHFFSEAERWHIKSVPESLQTEAFFRCWTRREAHAKASGLGIAMDIPAGITNDILFDGAKWWSVCSVPAYEGYAAALAAEGTCCTFQVFDWPSQVASADAQDSTGEKRLEMHGVAVEQSNP